MGGNIGDAIRSFFGLIAIPLTDLNFICDKYIGRDNKYRVLKKNYFYVPQVISPPTNISKL